MAIKVRFCPKCGSDEVKLVAGGNMGMYECKECGFRGAVFPEKEIDEEGVKEKDADGESMNDKGESNENKNSEVEDD